MKRILFEDSKKKELLALQQTHSDLDKAVFVHIYMCYITCISEELIIVVNNS